MGIPPHKFWPDPPKGEEPSPARAKGRSVRLSFRERYAEKEVAPPPNWSAVEERGRAVSEIEARRKG